MRPVQLLTTATLTCAAIAGAAIAGTATAAPGRSEPAHAAALAKVELRHTSLGKILVSSSGFTLYRFTRDPRGKDTCVTVASCAQVWPPLLSSGRPLAAAGIQSSLLGTIKLPSGRRQVTYAGCPLYLYAPAVERGETTYAGFSSFGGTWDAVNAAGKLVK